MICTAQEVSPNFVGSYFASEGKTEMQVLRISLQNGKLVAFDATSPENFNVRLASGPQLLALSSSIMDLSMSKISGIVVDAPNRARVILLKVPVGTVLEGQKSKTGYFMTVGGLLEVEKR